MFVCIDIDMPSYRKIRYTLLEVINKVLIASYPGSHQEPGYEAKILKIKMDCCDGRKFPSEQS